MFDDSFSQITLDLNAELIKHPASTFFARVCGHSMKDADVLDGDILIVDKSLEPKTGDIAVCCLNNEFTLKFIEIHTDHILLVAANDEFDPIKVDLANDMGDDFTIWGIVTYVIHKTSR